MKVETGIKVLIPDSEDEKFLKENTNHKIIDIYHIRANLWVFCLEAEE